MSKYVECVKCPDCGVVQRYYTCLKNICPECGSKAGADGTRGRWTTCGARKKFTWGGMFGITIKYIEPEDKSC